MAKKEVRNQKSEVKHTQGPWKVDDGKMGESFLTKGLNREHWPFVIIMPSPPFVLGATGAAIGFCGGNKEQAEANARLIANAPETKQQRDDLLEALKIVQGQLLDCCKYFLGSGEQPTPEEMAFATDIGEKAIAKTEGK